mgnify:CR=1 FL=1
MPQIVSLDAATLFERAKAALIAGDAAAAATAARQVVLMAPGAWPALYLLAVAERDSGGAEASRRAFEAALKAAPGHPDILNDYASLLEKVGQRGAAIARYREVVAARPDHLVAWIRLAVALGAVGALGEAHEAALMATKLAPDNAEVWLMMGGNRHAAGDADGAADALQRAVALAPNDVRVVRALAELETDRSGSGLTLFHRAAAMDPNDSDTAMGLALARHEAGETAEAIDALLELARRRPGWVAPVQSAARIAVTDGRPEAARAMFTEALEARPRDHGLWHAYLQMLAQHEDYPRVLTATEAAKRQLGAFPALDAFTAVALDETGDHAQASALLERLDASQSLPSIVDGRVRNLLRTGRIEEAAERAARGLAQDGRRRLWAYLATAWRMLGDPRSQWLEAPEFVQAVEIEDGVALAKAAEPALRALHKARAAPLGQTVRGGSQTDGQLFLRHEPEIRRLGEALQRAVEAYAATLPPIEAGHPLLEASRDHIRLSGWSVRLPSGGLHVNHIHPEGWLSSAFYVDLPELTPGTTEGWLAIGEPPKELKLGLKPYRLIEPKPGRLALFPSYAWHGTRLFGGKGERLTVAFDVMTG